MISLASIRPAVILTIAALALALPTAALGATSPMLDQYGNPGVVDPGASSLDPTVTSPDSANADAADPATTTVGAGDGTTEETVSPVELATNVAGVGALPMTGLELGLLVVGGALLLTSGFVLRRMGARDADSESAGANATA